MEFMTAGFSGKGGRSGNEDAIFIRQEGSTCLAVVADGLGMHGGGEIASAAAVEAISMYLENEADPDKKLLQECIEAANQAVLSKQTVTCKMKSTAAVLLSRNRRLAFAHVGDSRIYYFVNKKISYQSVDHSVSQMAVNTGEITPAQIRFHEDRNRLLRALGGGEKIRPDIVLADRKAAEGDAFLLCSDGFWEYVLEAEMELDLLKSDTPQEWLSYLLERVGRRIDASHDNLSAIAVFVCGK